MFYNLEICFKLTFFYKFLMKYYVLYKGINLIKTIFIKFRYSKKMKKNNTNNKNYI